jgi:hypothetical protein
VDSNPASATDPSMLGIMSSSCLQNLGALLCS